MLREPLLHFLVIGLILYLAYDLVNDDVSPNLIVITQGELDSFQARWTAARSRPPSDEEMQNMIDMAIKDKILAKEAFTLGLDQGDSVVQRRLAQKMEFLLSDLAQIPDPTGAELQDFLADNLELFSEPKKLSFNHIYFSPENRITVRDDAQQLLDRLRKNSEPIDIQKSGDRFMLPSRYESESQANISKSFGNKFAEKLFSSNQRGWQGPLESGYGIHLVFIGSIEPAKIPDLKSIRPSLEAEWDRRKQNESNETLYQLLREKYEVAIGDGG